ncbi:MAG TPA: malto-oligosyltrehalose synthase [Beijerinckiaceae bacterium]|jgi:(1->4)-alpha-D-glucan 1-alpha-D-glucosylmutase
MSAHDALIDRIAGLIGIAHGYTDAFGKPVESPVEARQAILSGFGLPTGTEDEARESLAHVERLRHGLVPALVPVEANRPVQIPLRLRDGVLAVTWRLTDEDGASREGRAEPADGPDGPVLALPRLSTGYHRLHVEAGSDRADATIVAAPPRCWEPRDVAGGARYWGLAAQLYALRSKTNLGIGTYVDAGTAAEDAGALGASFLGLSPVHALFGADRTKISPYSPSSRLFLETLHIDPSAVPGFEDSAAQRLLDERRDRIAALRDAQFVDHAGVWEVLRPVLDALWTDAQGRGGDSAFEAFRRTLGEPLESHATFEALSEHFRQQGAFWVGDWPEAFRSASSPEVQDFRRNHAERVAFHAWLQWLADSQLGAASRRARAAGMGLGLYRDLAVGADRGGSEVWSRPDRFGTGLSVGAPPDLLGPHGQDWGLPPFNPLTLEEEGLAAFRALVSANMRHAGAVRIDHAFQLQRLFLIPLGKPATQGAYVAYPFEAQLAVLRLESHRNRCMVIAEDLGTAPEGFSDAIMRSGLLSYRVLPFEREADGAFKRPEAYPRDALSVITTHDLPTFVGWWRGLDTDLRQTLGLYDRERAERERVEREVERHRLTEALFEEKLLPSPEPPEQPPFDAVARYLARTPSVLNAVQYEDVLGELNQPNMPGTSDEHPNWRRKLAADLDAIAAPGGPLAKLAALMAAEERGARPSATPLAAPPPRATYRLQFHKDFTFDHAAAVVPYLKRLGISHVYASPIHKARPGSTHGYDIVDHGAINPELGGEEGFYRLSDALREHGLGLVLDIVPNHMGVGGADNPSWLSVLEWGPLSPAAKAFDIDWERLGANHKLVVPFLGNRYGDALDKGELKLAFDAAEGSFSVWHYEHRFPVCPLSYPIILDRALVALGEIGTEGSAHMLAASERLRTMSEEPLPERRTGFPEEGEALKRKIAQAVAGSPGLGVAIERAVRLINGTSGIPESFGTLHRILEEQSYRPAHWRMAASDINYRRFFDINALAGLRVEEPEVFTRAHETVFRLVREGRIDGLRIDHVDGLADPASYVEALQREVGPGFYIVVEKILEPGEELRPWPIAGTTGYDVLNVIDGAFVDTEAERTFDDLYRQATVIGRSYGAQLRAAKAEILETSFASELEVLTSDVKRIADADRHTRDFAVNALRRALVEIVARFPVYRSYLDDAEIEAEDLRLVEETVEKAKRRSVLPDRTVHDFVRDVLLGRVPTEGPGRPDPELARRFRRRFQQLTGPVMAKSLEDTLFYRYVRLLPLNEVGGDPAHFGLSLNAFHKVIAERARDWPHAMTATATHDTKRGEDARGRLLALSEMPQEWAEAVRRFEAMTAPLLKEVDEEPAPDANDCYMLLQSLLSAWPNELFGEDDPKAIEAFRGRMEEYARKALREAKRHTSWVNVNEAYEEATFAVLRAILQPESEFLRNFRPLAQRLAFAGMLTGLARTVLKCTLPGVPDVYQGTEFWDLSLVDPDNRRLVDYGARAAALEGEANLRTMLENWPDGRIKQQVLARLLADRAAAPQLYAEGDYQPLEAEGGRARNVLAFRRSHGGEDLIVAVPRLVAGTGSGTGAGTGNRNGFATDLNPAVGDFWGDTVLRVPAGARRDVLTGAEVRSGEEGLALRELFSALPIGVLRTIR